MKKIVFVVPLMAISLLASCGGGKAITYNVTVGESDHLSFTTLDGKSLDNAHPKKNEEFKFKMKSIDEGSETYQVPSTLSISVEGAGEIIKPYYDINFNEDHDEAEVIVNASKVVGNITISGQAVPINNYRYEFKASYGLEPIESGVKSKDSDLQLKLKTIEGYALPADENIYIQFDNCPVGDKVQWVSPAEELKQYCEYKIEDGEGILTIHPEYIRSNIIIVARASDYPLLDKLSWEDIHKVSFSGAAEYVFYLGEEKTVLINNRPHKVHIIGFNEDYTDLKDKEHTAIGITFEFVNAISDENGYSLATYWNDTSDSTNANHDYKNSSVRKALIGEGDGLNWFRYYGAEEDANKNKYFVSSGDPYYQKSVLSMLPEDLTKFLATPSKYINIYRGSSWQEETVEDKLFLLSPVEMGRTSHDHEETDTSTYSYYLGAEQRLTTRIKHQVKDEEGARFEPLSGTDLSGQYTLLAKHSYAGYDGEDAEETRKPRGTYLWLRSPITNSTYYSYYNDRLGRINNYYDYYPYRDALNLAPAFCI